MPDTRFLDIRGSDLPRDLSVTLDTATDCPTAASADGYWTEGRGHGAPGSRLTAWMQMQAVFDLAPFRGRESDVLTAEFWMTGTADRDPRTDTSEGEFRHQEATASVVWGDVRDDFGCDDDGTGQHVQHTSWRSAGAGIPISFPDYGRDPDSGIGFSPSLPFRLGAGLFHWPYAQEATDYEPNVDNFLRFRNALWGLDKNETLPPSLVAVHGEDRTWTTALTVNDHRIVSAVWNQAVPTPVTFRFHVADFFLRIYYTGEEIVLPPGGGGGGGGGEPPGPLTALDVSLTRGPVGYWIASAAGAEIQVARAWHSDFPMEGAFSVAGGVTPREPRLALNPYSGELSCLWRDGAGLVRQESGGEAPAGSNDPFRIYRAISYDFGESWARDPRDGSALLGGMNGVKHAREVYDLKSGERLLFYNDQSETDDQGAPTGRGQIVVDIYGADQQKVGTFPDDGSGTGIGGKRADDSSFDALYIPEPISCVDVVYTSDGSRVRCRSYDNGRSWVVLNDNGSLA